MKDLIHCPKCKKSGPLATNVSEAEENKGFLLTEEALLTCPNCGAEFGMTASLKRLPGEGAVGGETPEDIGDELEDFGGDLGSDDLEPGGDFEEEGEEEFDFEEEEEEVDEEPEESSKHKSDKPHIFECDKCKKTWVSMKSEKCVHCESTEIFRTKTSIKKRIHEAAQDVQNGLPVSRAVDLMLATPKS